MAKPSNIKQTAAGDYIVELRLKPEKLEHIQSICNKLGTDPRTFLASAVDYFIYKQELHISRSSKFNPPTSTTS